MGTSVDSPTSFSPDPANAPIAEVTSVAAVAVAQALSRQEHDMSDRHVIPDARGRHVERDHRQRFSATTAARADAVRRAVVFVSLEGGGRVVVHDADGSAQETRTIPISGCEETADVVVPPPRTPTPERGSASGEDRPVASSPARRPPDVPRIGRADAVHRIDLLTEQAALPFDQLSERILAVATLVARLPRPDRRPVGGSGRDRERALRVPGQRAGTGAATTACPGAAVRSVSRPGRRAPARAARRRRPT